MLVQWHEGLKVQINQSLVKPCKDKYNFRYRINKHIELVLLLHTHISLRVYMCVCAHAPVCVCLHTHLSLYGGLLNDCFEWMIIVDLPSCGWVQSFSVCVSVCVLMFSVLICHSSVYVCILCVHVCLASKMECVLAARPISCKGGICCHRENMSASWQCRQGRFTVQWKKERGQNYTSNLDVALKREGLSGVNYLRKRKEEWEAQRRCGGEWDLNSSQKKKESHFH